MSDLVSGVQNKIISRQTACERLSGLYTTPDEFNVIEKEQHQEDSQDILTQVRLLKAQAAVRTTTEPSNEPTDTK